MLKIGRLIIGIGIVLFFSALVINRGPLNEVATPLFSASLLFLLVGILFVLYYLER